MTTLTPDALDREYNARAAIPEHPEIFARWAAASGRVREQLRWEPDYYYGKSTAETLDLFPATATGAPLLVFIHGGFWRAMDKRDFSFLAPAFVDAGVSVAIVNYGLAPAVSLEEMVRQMLRACAWLWRNCMGWGADPGRIYVCGHSAGAHLAAMMLAAKWSAFARDLPEDLVRGGLLVSGLYDLEPLARAPFLKDDLALSAEAARRLSPIHYRPERNLPLYTAVGGAESSEFQRQNRLIAEAWPHCFVQDVAMPGCHHLAVIEKLAEADSPLYRAALRLMLKG